MRIGFVHLGGGKGDGLRNRMIRDYLIHQGIEVKDLRLSTDSHNQPFVSHLTLPNLNSFFSIALGRRKSSLLKEITWNSRIAQLKRSISNWTAFLLEQADNVDLFHAETQIAAYACALVKQKTGKPFVFDVHGLQVEEMKGRDCVETSLKFFEKIEKTAVEFADYLSVVSPRMREIISETYQKPLDKFVVTPNGTILYPETAQFSKPLKVVFAGNFAPYERVQDFIGMADILRESDYEFYLMGDGELRDELFASINEKELDMTYLFRKPYEKTLQHLCQMHVGVAPYNTINGQAASSMKIRDYATCGLPIITPDVGEWAGLIKEYDAGIVTPKSDARQFSDALIQLSDQAVWEQQSKNAKKMVAEACLWEKMLEPLLGTYESILSRK